MVYLGRTSEAQRDYMKWLILMVLFIFAASCSPRITQPDGKVFQRYDDFDGRHQLILNHMHVGGNHYLSFATDKGSGRIRVMVSYRGLPQDGWRYLRCDRIRFNVGDSIVEVEGVSHQGRTGSLFYTEVLTGVINERALSKMMRADALRSRLCNTEFWVSGSKMDVFREFTGYYFDSFR